MRSKILSIFFFVICANIILIPSPGATPTNMVFVEGGAFQMGGHEIFSDEEPIHDVKISGFYIGEYEVSQKEWLQVMGTNPSLFKGDSNPVDTVSWYDAVEYCNKKSLKEGLQPCYTGTGDNITCNFEADGYRLPTEAEWEYAAGGGMQSHDYFYSGSNNSDEVGYYESNSDDRTQPQGRLKPNELGIYDMSGNTWEWCWDRYDKDYYKKSPVDNPRGALTGDTRIYRGGGGGGRSMWMRRTGRYSNPPGYLHWFMGFRAAKSGCGRLAEGMVYIQGGAFKMGSDKGSSAGERVIHKVTLSSFYMGKYEVTQEEWRAIMGYNRSASRGARTPVHSINYAEVIEYCNKRSRKEGLNPCYTIDGDNITCDFRANGYRLPTEAEWEYAARGGLQSRDYKYSGSNNIDEAAWYGKNSRARPHPVGQKKPNELGFYDMSGNVWEWCWDWFDYNYYTNSPALNPTGPHSGVLRLARGGEWGRDEENSLSTYRFMCEPHMVFRMVGFRVVRTAE